MSQHLSYKTPRRTLDLWELLGTLPSVSIIVVNYKKPDLTARCLASIAALDYPGGLQVVVVDNASTEESRDGLNAALRQLPCRSALVACDTNLGFAGGVLSGLAKTFGELICLLNNDATLHPKCLRELVEAYRGHSELGAVWPYDAPFAWHAEQRIPGPSEISSLRNGTHSIVGTNIWLPLLRDGRECFTGSGVCLLFSRQEANPPFPAEFFAYYEDVFLGWKLQLRGLSVERVTKAVIYHEGCATSAHDSGLGRILEFHSEKNRITNLIVFYSFRTLVRLLPILFLSEALKFSACVAGFGCGPLEGFRRLAVYLDSRLWLANHSIWILRLRRQVQTERNVSDEQLVSLMSGRLTMRSGLAGRIINRISLVYCKIARLRTVEFRA